MRRHKYGAQKTKIDGHTFQSLAEANYYKQLKLLQRAGEVTDIVLQPKYEIIPSYRGRNGRKVSATYYIADFLVTYKDGRQEIIDVKGYITPVYALKKKMFEYRYPDLTITEVS
ncbi:DUF1064 domain-containing protein [Paenibacillus sp. GYB003]|uniref:DUF1064 domain-containing protein n=1 Tax=Paenibacillus sp. GYB003 TaxID=2994392 RepID=UPI002F96287F